MAKRTNLQRRLIHLTDFKSRFAPGLKLHTLTSNTIENPLFSVSFGLLQKEKKVRRKKKLLAIFEWYRALNEELEVIIIIIIISIIIIIILEETMGSTAYCMEQSSRES